MPACARCSAENEAARFRCQKCGAVLKTIRAPGAKSPEGETAHEIAVRPRTEEVPVPRLSPPKGPAVAGEESHFLVASVLEDPFPLGRTTAVTIGRGEENNIDLPVQQVSRQHALAKWDGEAFAIIDRGSTNGTYVNDEIVKRRRLKPGDRIGIGPFELVFHAGKGDCLLPAPRPDTLVVAIPGSFSGDLTEVRVPEICQLIELNQKTGVLVFHYEDRRGKVYFTQGRAVHAEFRDSIGDAAALELLSLKKGSFRFFAKDNAGLNPTVKRPTASLLLEAARRVDEHGR